ncbi:hypothetical protein [Dictyobacter aurantiacus]|nr:hypothetical protein [Dictyobacter aurantiacus]
MPNTNTTAATKIFQRLKGLQARMQPEEDPILALPAIWDGGQSNHSTACDIIVTNQRVIGYYYRSFPRERVFFDALNLADLRTVTWRKKNYEPVFREILVSDGKRDVYIRTAQQKSEFLYETLRLANDTTARPDLTAQDSKAGVQQPASTTAQTQVMQEPGKAVYTREQVRGTFESSSLAVTILLVGGILIEILSLLLLFATHSVSISGPLFIAGFVMVVGSFLARKSPRANK